MKIKFYLRKYYQSVNLLIIYYHQFLINRSLFTLTFTSMKQPFQLMGNSLSPISKLTPMEKHQLKKGLQIQGIKQKPPSVMLCWTSKVLIIKKCTDIYWYFMLFLKRLYLNLLLHYIGVLLRNINIYCKFDLLTQEQFPMFKLCYIGIAF